MADREIEARDPLSVRPTLEQRRADALIGVLQAAETGQPQPGGGSAKVIVTLDYHQLADAAAGAGLISDGQALSAGELRRLCCGAGLVPVVLGTASEVLDVGRATRYATSAQWTALIARDGGCAFPGCGAQPSMCEAHHIRPWWQGGTTDLGNLVLLCHHHHGLIEPARHHIRDQWQVHIAANGLPEFTPPTRYDPTRTPIRSARTVDQSNLFTDTG